MVAQTKPPIITEAEYLRREQNAETKSEYYDGVIVAMAGASRSHNRITANVITQLNLRLQSRGCITYASDLRVPVKACNGYFYPDASVACGEPTAQNLEDPHSLQSPALIVEVLSASTELVDRGEKWHCYQTLQSLTTYVLITQDAARVEVYTRAKGDEWRLNSVLGLEHSVHLPAFNCEIPMFDLYAGVPLAEPRFVSSHQE